MKTANWVLAVFWGTHVIPAVIVYFMVDNETYQRWTLLYVTIASIWANLASHASAALAAKAGND